jgi:flagellar biosynthetic protein FliO
MKGIYAAAMFDSGTGIWSILFALLVLAGVLFLAYHSAKWLGKRAGGGRGRGNIEILDHQYVGQDKCLMIVRVGKRAMLLGVTSGQISKISEIDESELIVNKQMPESDFASIIRKTLEKRFPGKNGGDGPKGGLGS